MSDPKPSGWNEWAKYVLKAIEKQDAQISELTDKVSDLKIEITKITTRAATIGAAIPIAVYFVKVIIETLIKK